MTRTTNATLRLVLSTLLILGCCWVIRDLYQAFDHELLISPELQLVAGTGNWWTMLLICSVTTILAAYTAGDAADQLLHLSSTKAQSQWEKLFEGAQFTDEGWPKS